MQEIKTAQNQERRRKIFRAGLVFEKAGVLDTYNENEAITALKALKKTD